MTTTIISTVDNAKAGTALIAELVEAGLKGSDAEVLDGNHDVTPRRAGLRRRPEASGPPASGRGATGLVGSASIN